MAKSNVADILAAQRAVQALDKKGRLAILNDLKKQFPPPMLITGGGGTYTATAGGDQAPVATYEEGVEK